MENHTRQTNEKRGVNVQKSKEETNNTHEVNFSIKNNPDKHKYQKNNQESFIKPKEVTRQNEHMDSKQETCIKKFSNSNIKYGEQKSFSQDLQKNGNRLNNQIKQDQNALASSKVKFIQNGSVIKKSHEENTRSKAVIGDNKFSESIEVKLEKSASLIEDDSMKSDQTKRVKQQVVISSKVKSIQNQNFVKKSYQENTMTLFEGDRNSKASNEKNEKIEIDPKKSVSFAEYQPLKSDHLFDNIIDKNKSDVKETNNLGQVTFVSMVLSKETQTENFALNDLNFKIVEGTLNEIKSLTKNFDLDEAKEEQTLNEKQVNGEPKIAVSIQQEKIETSNSALVTFASRNFDRETQTEVYGQHISNLSLKKEFKSTLSRSDLVQSSLTLYQEEDIKKNPKTKKIDSVIIKKEDTTDKLPKIKKKSTRRILNVRPFSGSYERRKHDCLTKIETLNVANQSSKRNELQINKTQFYQKSENFQIFTRKSQVDYLIDFSNRILIQEKNPTRVKGREFLSGFNKQITEEI